jgi:AcrR family transcriptional regulator
MVRLFSAVRKKMRTQSEEKRQAIVRAAQSLFMESGFERTSMSMIAERMRGSKQTLYNYFQSKEDLLRAVLEYDVGRVADRVTAHFRATKDLREALVTFGIIFLEGQLSPSAIANIRIVSTQPAETGIGQHFYDNILCPAWKRLCQEFEAMMAQGQLRKADPWVAAMQWKGLVLLDLFESRLLGATNQTSRKQIEAAAEQAADAFLKIYGADPAPRKRKRSA